MKTYDVAILGAGTAGLTARKEVAKVTDNYVVIDPGPLGTTCARVGCMPSKALIQVANDFYQQKKIAASDLYEGQALQIDLKKALQHVRQLRDRFVGGVLKDMESWGKKHFIQKRAKLKGLNTLDLEGQKIQAKKIILATGSTPVIPKAWETYRSYFLDSNQVFELETLPKEMAVIGLGVIGSELGQALSRLGVEVTGFDRRRSLAALTDPQLIDNAVDCLAQEFPLIFGEVEILGEEKNQLVLKCGDYQGVFPKVLLSLGRKPNLAGLGLEKLNIEFNEKGLPVFDSNTFLIKNTSLFLAGDVNGERPVLHEAADQGRVAAYHSVRKTEHCFVPRTPLVIVFTDPNIATVGDSYQKLKEAQVNFVTGLVNFKHQGRAILKGQNHGLIHLYAHQKSGKFLGAEIFAPEGEHLAHLLAWALSTQLTVYEMLSLPFYHPVLEEGLRSALRKLASQLEKEPPPLDLLRCQDPPAGSYLS